MQGLEVAAKCGAKTVALTGLIPSSTNYGRSILPLLKQNSRYTTSQYSHLGYNFSTAMFSRPPYLRPLAHKSQSGSYFIVPNYCESSQHCDSSFWLGQSLFHWALSEMQFHFFTQIFFSSEKLRITTGHATTISAVVLTIRRALKTANRFMQNECVAILGLGSIGIPKHYNLSLPILTSTHPDPIPPRLRLPLRPKHNPNPIHTPNLPPF